MAHIYKITNTLNSKAYVGRTEKDPQERFKGHIAAARNNGPMVISKAIRKHGVENFKFEVLQECTAEEQYSRESYWIGKYDTYKNGYNSSMGGEGAGLGVKRERGAVHPHAKAVDCYDLKGNYLCTYNSRGEGAWETGRSSEASCINFCIQGKTFQAFGCRWAWKGEPLKEVNNRINRGGKVYGIHLKSDRKKMWESQADVAEEIEGNRKANNSLMQALVRNDKSDTTKAQVKGWYVFSDRKVALGDWKKAEKDLIDSLKILPDQAHVLNYLAYSWVDKGINLDRGLEMLIKANKIRKQDGYIIDSLGWAYYAKKNYIQAEKHLQRAVELLPSDPIINDHYADVLWMLNKNIQARYFWKYVLSLEGIEEELKDSINNKLIFGITKKL